MSGSKSQPDFEKSLEELQELIRLLEGGELSLEESLERYEKGVTLIRGCQQYLQDAEKRIEILTEKNEKAPFNKSST